ncbi:3-isopropylmalate dehydratase large subunit [Gossypium australe]|uniref:3-isopropylmalate dehydratase large subunit n=1 Tax=Gossypium australe TaxID=47621 RepID=A0A5B6UFX0_9ROSI|nr:3-isopropylmalate dehydratase large subunit [Gossypium australe]
MASSLVSSPTSSFLKKVAFHKCKKQVSKKIVSVMAPQQSERKTYTTGSVKTGMTMTEKILARASEKQQLSPGDNAWINVDILMTHDVCGPGSIGIFKKEFGEKAKVWDREKIVIIPDHYIFTSDERANRNVDILRDFCGEQNIKYFYDIKDLSNFKANPDYKGVCHVALAQEGHCRPGEVLLGTDSHTCTAGAFGQFATGIGNTDAGFVLGTGKVLLKVPPTLRFVMDGEMPHYLLAKDLILQIIGEISVAGATYKSMEFVGTTVESLNMEERMTLCNMVVEAGGKNGVVPADSTTFKYLEDKTSVLYEPVYSDAQASFLSEYRFDISKLEPLVAKPHSPDNRALARECKDVKIDRVYIGSCTGGKTEDFLAAAKVFLASGKKVKVPTFLVPATQKVWMDIYTLPVPGSGGKTCSQIFEEAGCDTPASPSCGACLGGPKDTYARMNEPKVCVSTTNRNFPGRMGHKEGQIYLASPYTAAASALTGYKDKSLSIVPSTSQLSIYKCKKPISNNISMAMVTRQSERKPATTGSMKSPMTMTEKILANGAEKAEVKAGDNVWVNVDVFMINDISGPGSIGIFRKEFGENAKVWDREKVVVIPDHYIFTSDERANRNVDILREFSLDQNIKYFYDITDLSNFKANPDYKGVCHIALAQEGHCRPGEILLGTDSHTCTAGAFGQFATGIGNTEAGFVLGTGALLLKIIGEISVAGATYKSMEFVGTTIESLNMEERMTLCNMVIEAGGKNGVVAADSTTFKYLEDKTSVPYEPVYSDALASFHSEFRFDISKLEPLVAKIFNRDMILKGETCPH